MKLLEREKKTKKRENLNLIVNFLKFSNMSATFIDTTKKAKAKSKASNYLPVFLLK